MKKKLNKGNPVIQRLGYHTIYEVIRMRKSIGGKINRVDPERLN
jgi:hypothetical protein